MRSDSRSNKKQHRKKNKEISFSDFSVKLIKTGKKLNNMCFIVHIYVHIAIVVVDVSEPVIQ